MDPLPLNTEYDNLKPVEYVKKNGLPIQTTQTQTFGIMLRTDGTVANSLDANDGC